MAKDEKEKKEGKKPRSGPTGQSVDPERRLTEDEFYADLEKAIKPYQPEQPDSGE